MVDVQARRVETPVLVVRVVLLRGGAEDGLDTRAWGWLAPQPYHRKP